MSQARYTREDVTPPAGGRTFDADLNFLSRWAGPLGLLARAMLAYIFIVEGIGKIAGYAGVADYMQAHGVDGRLLPLVILTELGGGLLVLFGLKTRWAAIALFGFCLLTALFFHTASDQVIELQKNVAMAGGFLTLAICGSGPWSLDAWRGRAAPSLVNPIGLPTSPRSLVEAIRQQLAKPNLMRMIDRLGSFDPCAKRAKGTAGVDAERIVRIMNVAIWRTALLQGPSLGTTGPRSRAVIPYRARK